MQSSSKSYPFDQIEAKWQHFWKENQTFRSAQPGEPGSEKPKYYVLDMFPYPSGAGLHVGHLEGYTATDIIARYKRMRGYNVLHPMGWDAFGLPAEQHAIQVGTHPRVTVAKNVANFKRQIQAMGFSYDWSREINTTDPGYYKWTQWIFLQLYKKDLAYVAQAPVWYCPALGTVLANEEVLATPSGPRSERGNHPVERRPLRQWMLRITAYAERLLKDLDLLDWPESLKEMQRNWIGRSEGAVISFQVADTKHAIEVYTTRPDTLWGATYVIVAPEHSLLKELTTEDQKAYVSAYLEQVALKSDLERTDLAKTKTGIFTGSYAINPANGQKLPIWVADYVLTSYGTGAVMAVPAHDERDFDFATEFKLPIVQVVQAVDAEGSAIPTEGCFTGEGMSVHSGPITGLKTPEAKEKAIQWLEAQRAGRRSVQYKLRDWLFSRQRYWGEPFPIVWKENQHKPLSENDLPLELPELDHFQPSPQGDAPLAKAKKWLHLEDGSIRETNTMPQWAGSCWYYLRYCDPQNNKHLVDPTVERYWMGEQGVDLYVGGAEHAVLHLLYARFWHKVLFDIGVVSTPEPFHKLVNQGLILGEDHQKMSKSLGNVINPDELLENYGADAIRLFEMFMGPLEQTKPWSTQGLEGVYRFLGRAWRLVMSDVENKQESENKNNRWKLSSAVQDIEAPLPLVRALHKAIQKITEQTEELRLNTAIAELMILVNELTPLTVRPKSVLESFVLLLSPFAPHIAEELWQQLGHRRSIAYEPWPKFDPQLIVEDEVEIVIQINGKIKDRLTVPTSLDKAKYEEYARSQASFKQWIGDKTIEKTIIVPQKLINFVVR